MEHDNTFFMIYLQTQFQPYIRDIFKYSNYKKKKIKWRCFDIWYIFYLFRLLYLVIINYLWLLYPKNHLKHISVFFVFCFSFLFLYKTIKGYVDCLKSANLICWWKIIQIIWTNNKVATFNFTNSFNKETRKF